MSSLTTGQKLLILFAAWLLLNAGVGGGAPIPDKGFRVLVVEETDARSTLSVGQIDAILSTKDGSVKSYVESKGGTFRVLDKDNDMAMLDKPWAALFARPRKELPWLEVSNPPRGFEGALPQNEADTLAIVKKAGG